MNHTHLIGGTLPIPGRIQTVPQHLEKQTSEAAVTAYHKSKEKTHFPFAATEFYHPSFSALVEGTKDFAVVSLPTLLG